MKKFIICLMVLCSFGAYATGENERVTSMGYVNEELETRQDKFQKLGADTAVTYSGSNNGEIGTRTITGDLGAESNTTNTAVPTVGAVNTKLDNKQDELNFPVNTVLMNTGTAGEPAAKGIYDDSGSYATQQDSLIDAATFNAALQNAINSEFTCAQRKDPNDPTSKCLLFNIFAPTQQTLLPNGYTPLEYIAATGTQYIDTDVAKTSNVFRFETKVSFADNNSRYLIGTSGTSPDYCGRASDGKFELNFSMRTTMSSGIDQVVQMDYYGDKNETHLTVTKGNETETLTAGRGSSTPDKDFVVFANNSSSVHRILNGKIYMAKIYIDNVLQADLVPARRDSDNAVGMYDLVAGAFRENAGTGDFIAGPVSSALNLYIPQNQQ